MKTICFLANEIWPGTNGGIGRLITETCQELAQKGIRPVILLENMDSGARHTFQEFAVKNIPGAKIYSVDELLAGRNDIIPLWAFHFNFYHRSYKISLALQALLLKETIDGIEFPDYLGLGYVFLKTRRLWKYPQLCAPSVWVRLHGSAELVENADDREQFTPESLQMYDMERYCLKHADFLVTPSESIAKLYFEKYSIEKNYLHAPPKFQKLGTGSTHPKSGDNLAPKRVLFYGKLQHVKGPDLFVKAGVAFLDEVDSNAEFFIIGQDCYLSRRYHSIKDELLHLIPERYKDRFIFTGRIKPEVLQDYVIKCQVAVIPSRFETFCLAAHELNWLGIPLILNDIPAFMDYFTHGVDCLKFDGTHQGLFEALKNSFAEQQQLKWNAPLIDTRQIDLYTRLLPQRSFKEQPEDKQPLVSVIVPYFNMHDYIDETLQSVFEQTYTHWEIIIVNDGSTQDAAIQKLATLKQLYKDSPRIKILHKINGGLGSARNHGIKHASGKYILPLDSDDILHSRFLAQGVQALEHNPDLIAVSCYVNFFEDGQKPESIFDYVIPYDLNPLLITRENRAGVASSLFKKEIFELVTYDETLFSYEDWDFWWTLAEKGYAAEVMPEILFHYRRRSSSMVNTIGRSNHAYLMIKIGQKHRDLLASICIKNYCQLVYQAEYEREDCSRYRYDLSMILQSKAFKIASFIGKIYHKLLSKFK